MLLLFIKFKFLRKNGVSEKIKAHYPQHLSATIVQSPPLLILFKKFLAAPPFKIVGDYTFYMRGYKGETIKLLPFYTTDFLFTELKSHNI